MSLCGNCPRCGKAHGVYDRVGIYGDFTLCRFCKSAVELEDKQKKLIDAQLAAFRPQQPPIPLCACGLHPENADGYCPAEQTARGCDDGGEE